MSHGPWNHRKNVAKRARALNPNIIYNEKTRLASHEEQELGLEYRSFQELLRESDVHTIHVPLNAETG